MSLLKFFSLIWKVVVPQKIKAFGWKCFINIFPTRELLLNRVISFPTSFACIICGFERKSLNHVLFSCSVSSLIWKELAS